MSTHIVTDREHLVGIVEIILSGFLFGFLGLFGKAAYEAGWTPGAYLSLRFVGASTVLFAFVIASGRARELKLAPQQIALCMVLGVCGYALFSSLYFEALQGLSASLTVLLFYTFPVLVALGEAVLWRKKLSRRTIVSLPLVLCGTAALVGVEMQAGALLPVIFGLGASLFYAFYVLISSRLLRGVPPLTATALIMGAAGLALAVYGGADFTAQTTKIADNWLALLGVIVIATVLPMSLFLSGLKKVPPSQASILSAAEPLTGVLLATAFLGESMTLLQLLGGSLVLTVMVYLAREPR